MVTSRTTPIAIGVIAALHALLNHIMSISISLRVELRPGDCLILKQDSGTIWVTFCITLNPRTKTVFDIQAFGDHALFQFQQGRNLGQRRCYINKSHLEFSTIFLK